MSQPVDVVTGRSEAIADLIPLLEGIRNEHIRPTIQATELNAPEQTGGKTVDTGRTELSGTEDTGANAPGERQTGESDNANGTGLSGKRGHRVSTSGTGKTRTKKGNGNNQSANGVSTDNEQPGDSGIGTCGDYEDGGLSIEAVHKAAKEGAITDAIYENYQPAFLKIPGSKEQPGKLVESAAMAAVDPPKPTYTPNLPKTTITQGMLSLPQLVGAHEQFKQF